MGWALIVHGGAHAIPEEKLEAHKTGCIRAVAAGVAVLEQGGSALDAVEAAIRVLEDDPTFNAGYGSMLNADGDVEMDAAIMEGSGLHTGAVASIRGVRHPISVARAVIDTPHALLSAEGARKFARERGCELCAPEEMIHEEMRAEWDKTKPPHLDSLPKGTKDQPPQSYGSASSQRQVRGILRAYDTEGCVARDLHDNFTAVT